MMMNRINPFNHTISNDYSWINTVLLGTTMFSLALITIIGNTIVIYAIHTDRHLRTVGNLFIASLAIADLIVGCFVMPIAGIYAIMEEWNMGHVLCRIWLSVDYTASTASIFNLLTLSLDRYWSITSPLQYITKRTRGRALSLIGIAWGLSLLWVIPIFGWDQFFIIGIDEIASNKCEPGYIHSKTFKVSTAVINFYLPLLVLICLNGRIYYEIKRRYSNVLLRRHSNQAFESPIRKTSRTPTVLDDNNRQICLRTSNLNEIDGLIMLKRSSISTNTKEKNTVPMIPIHITDTQRSPFKYVNSFFEQSSPTQDELTRSCDRKHSRSSSNPTATLYPRRDGSEHRLSVDERCYKLPHDYPASRLCSNEPVEYSHNHHRNSYLYSPSEPRSSISSTLSPIRPTDYCCRCSADTSAMTIYSDLEPYNNPRKVSSSSSSMSRKANTIPSLTVQRNSTVSNISSRSNPLESRASNKPRQSIVWNQQEKAFRQLFAIVFGFTCCYLPYFILYMVIAFCDLCVSDRIRTAAIWLGYVNSTINPFLYALSNEHYRRTFNHIFKREQRLRRQSCYK